MNAPTNTQIGAGTKPVIRRLVDPVMRGRSGGSATGCDAARDRWQRDVPLSRAWSWADGIQANTNRNQSATLRRFSARCAAIVLEITESKFGITSAVHASQFPSCWAFSRITRNEYHNLKNRASPMLLYV